MLYTEISHEDRQALWLAFEKRFPLGLEKEFLLQEAHLDKIFDISTSWEDIFEALQHKPRAFRRLLNTAVDMRPDDPNLSEVADLLRPEANTTWFVGIATAISVAILATIVFPTESNQNPFERTDRNAASHARMMAPSTTLDTVEIPIVTPVVEPMALHEGGAEEQNTREGLSTLDEVSVDLTALKSDMPTPVLRVENQTQRCSFEGNGEIIGYWYAGAEKPAIQDGWTTISYGRNVRLDYPEEHNGYNARATVTCVLFDNMTVPVQDEPILVAGSKYWIPLRSIVSG